MSQNRFHAFDVFYHSLLAVDQAPAENRIVRLAALLHDLGKVDTRARRSPADHVTFYNHQAWSARKAEAILRRLRYPNEERKRVVHLVQQHMFHYKRDWTDSAVRRFVRAVGTENLDDLFAARAADTLGNGLRRSAASAELTELRRRIVEISQRDGTAFSVRDLKSTARSEATLGIGEGPAIGRFSMPCSMRFSRIRRATSGSRLLARAGEILPEIEASAAAEAQEEGDADAVLLVLRRHACPTRTSLRCLVSRSARTARATCTPAATAGTTIRGSTTSAASRTRSGSPIASGRTSAISTSSPTLPRGAARPDRSAEARRKLDDLFRKPE